MDRLSEQATFHDLDKLDGSDGEPGRQDIGGTNAQTDWVDMLGYVRAVFFAVLGKTTGPPGGLNPQARAH